MESRKKRVEGDDVHGVQEKRMEDVTCMEPKKRRLEDDDVQGLHEERMEDDEVGRYMLKKGGRDRPTNLENLQLSIGRSRYVVVGPRRSLGRFFICFMGCQTLLSISDSGRERAALDHEKLLCFC